MIEITDVEFAGEVLESEQTVVVDFYADWCRSCKALAPVLFSVANINPSFKVVKLNIEKAPDIAKQYGVTSIPFLGVFKDG